MSPVPHRLSAPRPLWPWLAAWLLVTSLPLPARADLRWVRFSGYDWWVKSSAALAGPGPNYFSDSTNNVWVDAQGQLHLKTTCRLRPAPVATRRQPVGHQHLDAFFGGQFRQFKPALLPGAHAALRAWIDYTKVEFTRGSRNETMLVIQPGK